MPTSLLAILGGVVAMLLPALTGTALQEQRGWVGADGARLPFRNDAEVIEFLRSAEIVERTRVDIGVNGIDQLLLEKNGVRAHAGFRDVDVRERSVNVGGEHFQQFRDSFLFECAAYELARYLGIDNVPPAIPRRIGRVDGSVQLWVEGVREAGSDDFAPPDRMAWVRQVWTMTFFDSLIYNVDRNPGNVMVDDDYKLWMIDHTRAFQTKSTPYRIDRVDRIARLPWARLLALSEDDARALFRGLLELREVATFWERRERLVAHLQALIAERGEDVVIY